MDISEERRREMEEEMNRFEAEIDGPGVDQRFILGSRTFQAVQAQLKTIRAGVEYDEHDDAPATLPLSALIAPPPPPPLCLTQPPNGQAPGQPPPPPPRPAFVPPQLRNRPPPPPRPPMPLPARPPMQHPGMRFPGPMGGPPGPMPPHMGGQQMMGGPQGPMGGGGPQGPMGGGGPQEHMNRPQGPMPPHMGGLHGPMGGPQGPMGGPHGPMGGPHMGGGMGPPMMRPFGPPHGWSPMQEMPSPAEIEKPRVVYSAEPVRTIPKKEKKKKKPKVAEPTDQATGSELIETTEAPVDLGGYDIDGEAMATVPTETEEVGEHEVSLTKKERKEKKKKYVRTAAGTTWEDPTLAEWENDDFRMFCGDLGNEVTDEHLARAFSKFPSFLKAKIVRDRRSNKSKGYGFVSFRDPTDFTRAMREMNGKYVGNRPIKLRKSTWRDRNIELVRKKEKEKKRLGLR